MIQQWLIASFATATASGLLTWLVDYYKFDSNSNNSTGNWNWTDTNISYATAWIIWNSATFSNTWYIELGHKIATWAKSFSFWLKTTSTTDDIVIDEWNRSSNTICDTIDINTTANKCTYFVFRWSSWNFKKVISATSVNSWSWIHIVCTDDWGSTASNLKMYINWTLDATGTQSGSAWTQTWTATNNAVLWASVGLNTNLTWSIDELWIWSRELTSTEATELYNSWSWKTYPF